jgi:hypothetical protein
VAKAEEVETDYLEEADYLEEMACKEGSQA